MPGDEWTRRVEPKAGNWLPPPTTYPTAHPQLHPARRRKITKSRAQTRAPERMPRCRRRHRRRRRRFSSKVRIDRDYCGNYCSPKFRGTYKRAADIKMPTKRRKFMHRSTERERERERERVKVSFMRLGFWDVFDINSLYRSLYRIKS